MRTRTAFALTLLASATPLAAQRREPCNLVITGIARGADTTRMRAVTSPDGVRNTYVGGGVDATCAGTGNRLLADSAEHFTDRGLLILYHNVRYSEPRMTMTSDRMFYYTNDERIVAEGNVHGKTAAGTRFNGPQFEYFRVHPDLRDQSSWVATGRPFVRMSPTESASGAPAVGATAENDSTDITANRVYSVNDSLVWASGAVVIDRSDMRATSDSATIDNGIEFARLLRDPKVVGKGEQAFTLDGVVINIWSKEQKLERVMAADSANAVSDSLVLSSDTIDMRFAEQAIQRIYSFGTRALADGNGQKVESDSMDIRMPNQRLEELRAVGKAQAWSYVDTTRIISTERDWIRGDTIVAGFETVQDGTGADRTQMKQIISTGNARAFYQVPPAGGGRGEPNLSYNRGRKITVAFKDGEMATVTVSEGASGIYLEAPATSTPVVPTDTTRSAPGARRP